MEVVHCIVTLPIDCKKNITGVSLGPVVQSWVKVSRSVCDLCTSAYFKTPETKTTIDPGKIPQEIFLSL